jgi:uncharacterized protein YjbJ (UPF0337 family)
VTWPGRKPGHELFDSARFLRNPAANRRVIRPSRGDAFRPPKEHGGSSMNWDQIEGNWVKTKGKLRQQWGKLTDDDLTLIDGKREELAGRLQERYGYQKEQAEKEIDAWMKKAS